MAAESKQATIAIDIDDVLAYNAACFICQQALLQSLIGRP